MAEDVPLRHYQLKDTRSPAHPTHSFQAWRGDSVRYTFTHVSSPHKPRWEVTDRDQAPVGTLLRHPLHADSLTLQVPDKPEVTIRQVSLRHSEWALEYPTVTLLVKHTDDFQLPILSKSGERTLHFIVYLPDGSEAAALRLNMGRAGGSCSVVVARWSPLIALSLGVAICVRDWQVSMTQNVVDVATDPRIW